MAINGEQIKLGVYMYGNILRIVEAQKNENAFKILRVAESSPGIPFNERIVGDYNIMQRFSEAIKGVVDREGIYPGSAHFALDHRLVIPQIISFDGDLNTEILENHIEWEISQYLISSREEYNVDFEKIKGIRSGQDRYYVAAVRKKLVNYIQEIFDQSTLTLNSIDVDLFSAIKAFKSLQQKNSNAVLINCDDNYYNILIVKDGSLLLTDTLVYSEEDYQGSDPAFVANELNSKIADLMALVQGHVDFRDMSTAYFYGDNVTQLLMDEFSSVNNSLNVAFLNPFRDVYNDLDMNSQQTIQKQSERFLQCVGMAL